MKWLVLVLCLFVVGCTQEATATYIPKEVLQHYANLSSEDYGELAICEYNQDTVFIVHGSGFVITRYYYASNGTLIGTDKQADYDPEPSPYLLGINERACRTLRTIG